MRARAPLGVRLRLAFGRGFGGGACGILVRSGFGLTVGTGAATAHDDAGLNFLAHDFGGGLGLETRLGLCRFFRGDGACRALYLDLQFAQHAGEVLGAHSQVGGQIFDLDFFIHTSNPFALAPYPAQLQKLFATLRIGTYIPAPSRPRLGLVGLKPAFPRACPRFAFRLGAWGKHMAQQLRLGKAPSAYHAHPGGLVPSSHITVPLPRDPGRRSPRLPSFRRTYPRSCLPPPGSGS